MRRSGRLLIVMGVMMGLAALLLGIFAMSGGGSNDDSAPAEASKPQEVTIVQVKGDIPAHTILKASDLEEVVVKDETLTGDEVRSVSQVVGFAYADDLVTGQRIMQARLEVSGISEKLEPGTRAISITVDKNNLIAGLIREDDRVDLIYQINADMNGVFPTSPIESQGMFDAECKGSGSGGDEEGDSTECMLILPRYGDQPDPAPYPYPGEPGSRFVVKEATGGNPITKVVLQNVRVLRVINDGAETTGGGNQPSDFLVLEVSPDEAELMRLMQSVGQYQIMLRNPSDEEQVTTTGANMEILFSKYGMPAPKTVRLPGPGAQ